MKERNKTSYRFWIVVLIIVICFLIVCRLLQKRGSLPSREDRVLAVTRLYQAVQDYYCYLEVDKVDWNATYEKALKSVARVRTYREYLQVLEELRGTIHDGHGDGEIYTTGLKGLSDIGVLPFHCLYINGQYVVVHSVKKQISPGDILLSIDGQKTDEWLEEKLGSIVSVMTPDTRQSTLAFRFCYYYPRGKSFFCAFQGVGGQTYSLTVRAENPSYPLRAMPSLHSHMIEKNLYSSRYNTLIELPDGIFWLQNHTMQGGWEDFTGEVLPRIQGAEGVILDLRSSEGGNSGMGVGMLEAISGRVLNSSSFRYEYPVKIGFETTFAALLSGSNGEIRMSALEGLVDADELSTVIARGEAMQNGGVRVSGDQYATILKILGATFPASLQEEAPFPLPQGTVPIPLVVLIDQLSGSAVDTTAQAARDMGIMTVGTHTAGATGELFNVDLGGGLSTSFSCFYIFNEEMGTPLNNHGVTAETQVDYSADDIRAGLDTQLLAAWRLFGQ